MLAGKGSAKSFDPKVFMETMMAVTLEGIYGDPTHGGNVDGKGWASIGYAMHPPRPGACPH